VHYASAYFVRGSFIAYSTFSHFLVRSAMSLRFLGCREQQQQTRNPQGCGHHKEKAMKSFLSTLAIAILTLACVAQTQAGPKTGGKPSVAKPNTATKPTIVAKTTTTKTITPAAKSKITAQGVKFAKGIFYKGKNQNHWGLIRWDLRYGCYCYWDPCVLEWYYWCEQDDCYYPVSYCPFRTYSSVGVPETAEPVSPPTAGETATTILPDAQPTAPVSNDIPPIPEPVVPRE
jgi:hypothetical protein